MKKTLTTIALSAFEVPCEYTDKMFYTLIKNKQT